MIPTGPPAFVGRHRWRVGANEVARCGSAICRSCAALAQTVGMSNEQRVARTKRCPDPSPAVVKQLFGTAAQCGQPTCNETLYRIENDRPALNCRIAHIRASSPNGPRSDPLMRCDEVNAFDNLLLLCQFHASLIDDSWEDFPVDMLADWKRQQVAHASVLGIARQPTDSEVAELIIESRSSDTVMRSASVDLARATRRLRSAAERTRDEPRRIEAEQSAAERQLQRGTFAFNSETGERLQAQLSRNEQLLFAARISESLAASRASVETVADSVLAEAAGLAAALGAAGSGAYAWVERSVRDVVERSGEWNDALTGALEQLDAAVSALIDTAAGRATHVPPPPAPVPPEEPSPVSRFFERCEEVHERAARHGRVDHLPFDEALRVELLDVAPDCAAVPTVMSLVPFDSRTNASLAAAVMKNCDDEQFAHAVQTAADLHPEAAAAHHLLQLRFLAAEHEWAERHALVQIACNDLSAEILQRLDSREYWERNVEHGSFLLRFAEMMTDAEEVSSALVHVVARGTALESVLIALAETVETHDSTTGEFLEIKRRYRGPDGPGGDSLPSCVPVDEFCASIRRRWPAPDVAGSEAERLAGDFLSARCSQTPTP